MIVESRFKDTTFYRGEKTATKAMPTATFAKEKNLSQKYSDKTLALALMSNDMNSVKKK